MCSLNIFHCEISESEKNTFWSFNRESIDKVRQQSIYKLYANCRPSSDFKTKWVPVDNSAPRFLPHVVADAPEP